MEQPCSFTRGESLQFIKTETFYKDFFNPEGGYFYPHPHAPVDFPLIKLQLLFETYMPNLVARTSNVMQNPDGGIFNFRISGQIPKIVLNIEPAMILI